MINCFFGDRKSQHADSERGNLASIGPSTQAIDTRAIMQINHKQEVFTSIFSDHENRLAEQRILGVMPIIHTENFRWQHYEFGFNAAENFSWDLSEQKSGRSKSDYQRDLFSDSRGYDDREWRVLYCLKHVAECRPGWSLLHKHYPNLLVRDVLMVLPKETVRHFLASLAECTGVAHNDETRVMVQPFSLFKYDIEPLSLFRKRDEDTYEYDIEPLTDWLTLSMYHALAQAVNDDVIAPRSGMVSWDGLD